MLSLCLLVKGDAPVNGHGVFRISSAAATAQKRSVHRFFFSSRRRHTRFDCDWSSDVCSSDLCEADVRGAILISCAAGHGLNGPISIGSSALCEFTITALAGPTSISLYLICSCG